MSLKFETTDWKFELTWEALHIHPKGDSAAPHETKITTANTFGKKYHLADYFFFNPFAQSQTKHSSQEQE